MQVPALSALQVHYLMDGGYVNNLPGDVMKVRSNTHQRPD